MPLFQSALREIETFRIESRFLERSVTVDCYLPQKLNGETSLLLINDGQDLLTMDFHSIMRETRQMVRLRSLMSIGIHCGKDRKNEYGTASVLDYKGRGAKANLHNKFVLEELLPFIRSHYQIPSFQQKAFAGFSLGGLSAMDIVWNHPEEFTVAGVFSGSFWWRDVSQDDENFDEDLHRIMHRQVREGRYHPWQRYLFEVGPLDETADRNNNGIIDSIDDTVSLIEELKRKGCPASNIRYLQLEDGRHDVTTWGNAFPAFLIWAFASNS
jgi:enterochelin esterase-like enzyme